MDGIIGAREMSLTTEKLLEYFERAHILPDEFGPETPLFSDGFLDSASMMALLFYIEEESGITIGADDVTLDNFDSIERILAFAEAQ